VATLLDKVCIISSCVPAGGRGTGKSSESGIKPWVF
jgi:hypothetical protein